MKSEMKNTIKGDMNEVFNVKIIVSFQGSIIVSMLPKLMFLVMLALNSIFMETLNLVSSV